MEQNEYTAKHFDRTNIKIDYEYFIELVNRRRKEFSNTLGVDLDKFVYRDTDSIKIK